MSSGGGGTSTSTTQNYSPEEVARRTAVMDEAQRLYGTGQIGGTWSNAAPVAQSNASAAGESALTGAASTQTQQASTANDALRYGLTGAMDVTNNPYLSSAMDAAVRPQQEALTQALQQVGSSAQAQGAYGGSRQGIAEALTVAKGQQAISDTVAKMGSSAYDTGQQTFRTALGLAPSVQAMQTASGTTLTGVGAAQEDRAQATADYSASKAAYDADAQKRALEAYANIVLNQGGSQSKTDSTLPETDTTAQNAGLAMMAAYLAYSISDKRLKKDVRSVENPCEAIRQMSGVLFTYSGTGIQSAGVIAQDQEDVTPELVAVMDNGYKAVNYGGLAAYFIEGFKAVLDQIDDLKAQVAELREKQND